MRFLTLLILMMFTVTFIGCGSKSDESDTADEKAQAMQEEIGEAVTATKEYLKEQKDALIQNSEKQIEALQEKMKDLESRAVEKGSAAGTEFEKYQEKMKDHLSQIREKMDELSESGKEQFDQSRDWIQSQMDKAQQLYNEAEKEVESQQSQKLEEV